MQNVEMEKDIKKILVFDVFGDYAHFRRINTTTSPLTYPIPPRTALCGLIGAILGLSKDENEYLSHFTRDKAKIGLRVLSPIKKVTIAENLIHTKNAKGIGMNLITDRSPTNFEFLKDPKYRIYFWHEDKTLYGQLKNNLLKHKSVYTPCFGLSENIANFEYVGEFDVLPKDEHGEFLQIHSVIPMERVSENGINFSIKKEYLPVNNLPVEMNQERISKLPMLYHRVNLPVEMNQERIVTKRSRILLEENGNPIEAKIIEHCWEITRGSRERENVFFIE